MAEKFNQTHETGSVEMSKESGQSYATLHGPKISKNSELHGRQQDR